MALGRYRELTRIPGVSSLLAAAAVARLPYGMNTLALILLLRAEGFDYAEAGIVAAASGLAIGATAPLLGRLIDRVGQTRVLVATAGLCLVASAALVAAALAGAGVVALAALALAVGLGSPPVSPALRTLLPGVVGRERLDTAFAFDALQIELAFILGPLLAAGIATAVSPEAAYGTGAAMQTAGALGLAATRASRGWRPAARTGVALRSVLSSGRLRPLVISLAITAIAVGALDIGITAFAEREAARSDAGWLFALWGAGSLTGGLWYGARHWGVAADARFLIVSGVMVLGLLPLPLASSMPAFGVLVFLAGLGLAPSAAAVYSLIGELAPAGAVTEAYAWQIVGYVAGGATGTWLGGAVVEAAGVEAALACAPAAAALGWLVALARRRSLAVA
jgi:MFS family permease